MIRGMATGLLIGMVIGTSVCGPGPPGGIRAGEVRSRPISDPIHRLAARFQALASFEGEERVVYGDNRGYIHVLERQGNRYEERWKTTALGSSVQGVLIADLEGDGTFEIVTYTTDGRMYILDGESYEILWRTEERRFSTITAASIADVDEDVQKEIIFCADGRLYIYDGQTRFEEWRSNQNFEAQEILVADIDDDGEKEIVLNTGTVLGARFRDVEWQAPEGFGRHIGLLDVDDDGIPELLAESSGRVLKVFDLELRREKW